MERSVASIPRWCIKSSLHENRRGLTVPLVGYCYTSAGEAATQDGGSMIWETKKVQLVARSRASEIM